ncbi:MAG: hypothetical protein RR770_02360 [Bacteroidales bacterium]
MSKINDKLFRQQSLDGLSGTEQITEHLRVTHPSLILLLAGLFACCISVTIWVIYGTITDQVQIHGVVFPHNGITRISTPYDGVVSESYVKRGKFVRQGDPLLRIMCNGVPGIVRAQVPGVVLSFKAENEHFSALEPTVYLLFQEQAMINRELIAYVPFIELRKLKVGQQVQVTPSDLKREEYGYMIGHIASIANYPTTKEEAISQFKVQQFASEIFPTSTAYEVKITLDNDELHPNKIHWSRNKSKDIAISVGTFCNLQIITDRKPIYELVFKTNNLFSNIKGE